jgi:hypothetical protein
MARMRRFIAVPLALVALLLATAVALGHDGLFDHPVPTRAEPAGPVSSQVNAGGDGAQWELVTTIPTGNPHSDLDFFTVGGDTYMTAGTLGVGPNAGGQNIFRLTEGGAVKPSYVTGHPSAACPGLFTSATGLQHDVEATPKGTAFQQQPNPFIARGDAQLLIDATDATGRCHDNGNFGAGAPNGGLEIIDVTNPAAPKEIALTSHIGNAHTVNVDPKRPHIAFDITQDGVSVDPATGQRVNEADGSTSNALDGFELLDLSSCMNFPAGTTIEQKRARCRPEVYRYRYPEARMAASHTYPNNLQSCHEVEIYPDDRLACASITATLLFDLAGAFDDRGTPNDFTDDKPRGTPLPCKVRESTSPPGGGLRTRAPIVDCVTGTRAGRDQPLRVSEWKKIGSPSLEGVRWIGTVPHMGIAGTDTIANAPIDAKNDVLAAHESELSQSGRFVMTSDERGGGVVPGGASCTPGADNERGNGGVHFYPVSAFTQNVPMTTERAHALYAKTSKGGKAIYRANIRTGPQGSFCTAHVFQQIPGQNRIFMGWYSQGTQVFDFTENADGTVDFREAGWFTPENANTWVSHVFKVERNRDGTFTYWGAASDGILPGSGRGAIDIYKVTLPPAPIPFGGPAPGTPEYPLSSTASQGRCATTTAFDAASVARRGRRGLRFGFSRRGSAPVAVDLFRQSAGRRVLGERRVKRFTRRSRSFTWDGRGRRIRDGFYVARFTTTTARGASDVRRVALLRRRGRWSVRPQFYRRESCRLLAAAKLTRPVFGGRSQRALGISFNLRRAGEVAVDVRQRGRVIARFPKRAYVAGRTIRLRLGAARVRRRGDVTVTLRATRTGAAETQTLTARRL